MPDSLDVLAKDWAALPHASDTSNKFVLGDICLAADRLLIGEAPGEDEDNSVTDEQPLGRAFVGRGGHRLNTSLTISGSSRAEVSVANVLPRRPKDNRDPTDEEIGSNVPFLNRLIALHPNLKVIGLLGGTALKAFTGREKISDYRGCEFQKNGFWFVPTYHPAAILRKPTDAKWFVQDLRWMQILAERNLLDTSTMDFPWIDRGDTLLDYKDAILQSPISYIDLETAAIDGAKALWWWDPRVWPVLVSFAWFKGDNSYAVVVEVNDDTIAAIREILAGNPQHWAGSNSLYYDFPLLRRYGLPPTCQRTPLDSYPIARLNDENRGTGAKDLAKQHLHVVNYEPWWGAAEEKAWQSRWHEWDSMSLAEKQDRMAYAGKDAWLGIQTLKIEMDRLQQKSKFVKAYRDMLIPQAQAIEEMNLQGLPFNMEGALNMSEGLQQKVDAIAEHLQTVAPEEAKPLAKGKRRQGQRDPINFSSWKQVSRLLYEFGGLPALKKTPSGEEESSDRFVLLKLRDLVSDAQPSQQDSPGQEVEAGQDVQGDLGQAPSPGASCGASWAKEVISGILDIRDAEKTRGYVNALIVAASESYDGRIHSTFKPGPVTYRIASEGPNVMQLPETVKSLIVAPMGWSVVKQDFSNLEGRGLADRSQDPKMIQRFRAGEDLHWRHAVGFMTWSSERQRDKSDIFAEQVRKITKTLLFATGYGAGSTKIADTLRDDFRKAGISADVVRQMLDARRLTYGDDIHMTLASTWMRWLDAEYPRLKKSFFEGADLARIAGGVVEGKFGIEWHFHDLNDADKGLKSEAERQVRNYPIQNLSLLTFLAYRELNALRSEMGLVGDVFMLLNEHDSNVWLVREEWAEIWNELCLHVMRNPDWAEWKTAFAVPLEAEGSVGGRWR